MSTSAGWKSGSPGSTTNSPVWSARPLSGASATSCCARCPGSERCSRPPCSRTIFGNADLRADAISVEFLLEQPHAAELTVSREDMSHDRGFGFVYDQLTLADLVPEWHQAAHPDALALGGGDFVADALAGHLPFELRERQQDVQCKATHRSGRIELLGHGDERDAAGIEDLDHLGEIRQRAREPVHLINHDGINQPLIDIGHKSLQRWAFHGGAGEAAIIVMVSD